MDRERGVEERESSLELGQRGLEEGGLLGGLGGIVKGIGQMVTPRAGLPGHRGLGDIFNEFVEFSPLGDIGDIGAAFDPNSGLDPLERVLAASPFLGVGAVGARTAYKHYSARHLQGLGNRTLGPSMAPPQGQPYDLTSDVIGDQGAVAVSDDQRRAMAARFEQLALERKSPFARSTLRAESWDELAVSVAGPDAHPGGRLLVQDGLREIGAAVVAIAPDPKLYGTDSETQQFVAAKIAITKWNRAMELGLVEAPREPGLQTKMDLMLDPTRVDNILKIARFEAALHFVGPDLTLPTPARIGQVEFDETTGEPKVYVATVDDLLPTERVWDHDIGYPLDEAKIRTRQQKLEYEALAPNAAVNIAKAMELAPEQAKADPSTWYRNFNRSARVLAEATGFSVHQTSGVIATLSANTPWLPQNLIGAVHVVLQTAGIEPGTPQYAEAFREATVGSGWQWDMYDESNVDLRTQYGPTAETGFEPDFEGLQGYYADPANVTSEEGRLPGTDDDKIAKTELILKGNLPPWLVLRMMKTNTFGRLGAEPSLADLVVTDTWSDRIFWGSFWTGTPLGFDGRTPRGEIKADQTYFDPVAGDEVKGSVVLERLDSMRAEHGWTQKQVDRFKGLLSIFPSQLSQARFLAGAHAHLLVRDALGLEKGHEVQAPTWVHGREWKGLGQRVDDAKNREELAAIAAEGNLDTTLFTHLEGNPQGEKTAAGMLWTLDPTLRGAPPKMGVLDAARKGAQRPSSSSVKSSIISIANPDGTVTPYANLETPGVRETLRHGTPSGLKSGKFERIIANRAQSVVSVQDRVAGVLEYRTEDGRLAAGSVRTTVDPASPGHPAMLAGNRIVVLVPHDSVTKVEQLMHDGWAFDYRMVDTRHQRLGVSRNKAAGTDLEAMSDSELGDFLQENDWIAITAFRGERTDGQNWDAQRRLKLEIQKRGGEAIEANGRYPGEDGVVDEPSFFVTGLTYRDAMELGRRFDQEAVATRFGMLNMDGTYHPVTGKPAFGDAVDENSHTRLATGQHFSFDYDWETSESIGADPDVIADQVPDAQAMKEITIELGGEYGGATWDITDRLLGKLEKVPGARVRVYSHAPNQVPSGYERVGESVVTDDVGVTGSVLMKTPDIYSRHQADVYVPRWEAMTLSEGGFGAERTRRDSLDARSIMKIDEAAGMVWFDGDLAIQVDPAAEVTMTKTGSIFGGLRVNGSLVRQLVVDTNGPVPILDARGADVIPTPGRTVVDLTRGSVSKIMPDTETDFADARDALAAAGLIPDGDSVTVEYPTEGPEGVFTSTLRLSYGPHPTYGRSEVLAKNQPTIQADIDTTARVRQIIPAMPKVILGENAHPDLHRQLVGVLEGLHDGTMPGSHLVGSVPKRIWGASFGINTATIIDEKDIDAVTMMDQTFNGVMFNERQMVTRWNNSARPKGGQAYRPEAATDFEAVLVHEVGHMVEVALARDSFVSTRRMRELVDDAYEALGVAGTRLHLSRYAENSHREFFAEAFAKVMIEGDKAHPALVDMVSKALFRIRGEI